MKYVALMVGLFWTSLSFAGGAFTYHGISSGMTSDEVDAITGCEEECWSLDDDEIEKWFSANGNVPPGLEGMGFKYTSGKTGGKLWRIELNFRESFSGATAKAAQLRVLNELYPDADIQSDRVELFSDYYVNYLTALMIDSALFDADVEAIYQDSVTKY